MEPKIEDEIFILNNILSDKQDYKRKYSSQQYTYYLNKFESEGLIKLRVKEESTDGTFIKFRIKTIIRYRCIEYLDRQKNYSLF